MNQLVDNKKKLRPKELSIRKSGKQNFQISIKNTRENNTQVAFGKSSKKRELHIPCGASKP